MCALLRPRQQNHHSCGSINPLAAAQSHIPVLPPYERKRTHPNPDFFSCSRSQMRTPVVVSLKSICLLRWTPGGWARLTHGPLPLQPFASGRWAAVWPKGSSSDHPEAAGLVSLGLPGGLMIQLHHSGLISPCRPSIPVFTHIYHQTPSRRTQNKGEAPHQR